MGMAQSTLTVTPINTTIQKWISDHASTIDRIARQLGVPSQAIAAPLIQEAGTIIFDLPNTSGLFDDELDHRKRFVDYGLDGFVSTWPGVHDTLFGGHLIADDFVSRESDIKSGIGITNPGKIRHVTENDIGWGNINLGTAVFLLKDYQNKQEYGEDPLHLQQYFNDYNKFAQAIIDPKSDVSFALSGLMAKRGDTFFKSNDGAAYEKAPDQVKSALLTTWFKQGEAKIS